MKNQRKNHMAYNNCIKKQNGFAILEKKNLFIQDSVLTDAQTSITAQDSFNRNHELFNLRVDSIKDRSYSTYIIK